MTTKNKEPEQNPIPKKKLWTLAGILFLFALLVNISIYYKVINYGP